MYKKLLQLELVTRSCYFRFLNLVTGAQIQAARALLRWRQDDLAEKAQVALGTVIRMEAADRDIPCRISTLNKIERALEKAGIEFLNDNRPGVRLK